MKYKNFFPFFFFLFVLVCTSAQSIITIVEPATAFSETFCDLGTLLKDGDILFIDVNDDSSIDAVGSNTIYFGNNCSTASISFDLNGDSRCAVDEINNKIACLNYAPTRPSGDYKVTFTYKTYNFETKTATSGTTDIDIDDTFTSAWLVVAGYTEQDSTGFKTYLGMRRDFRCVHLSYTGVFSSCGLFNVGSDNFWLPLKTIEYPDNIYFSNFNNLCYKCNLDLSSCASSTDLCCGLLGVGIFPSLCSQLDTGLSLDNKDDYRFVNAFSEGENCNYVTCTINRGQQDTYHFYDNYINGDTGVVSDTVIRGSYDTCGGVLKTDSDTFRITNHLPDYNSVTDEWNTVYKLNVTGGADYYKALISFDEGDVLLNYSNFNDDHPVTPVNSDFTTEDTSLCTQTTNTGLFIFDYTAVADTLTSKISLADTSETETLKTPFECLNDTYKDLVVTTFENYPVTVDNNLIPGIDLVNVKCRHINNGAAAELYACSTYDYDPLTPDDPFFNAIFFLDPFNNKTLSRFNDSSGNYENLLYYVDVYDVDSGAARDFLNASWDDIVVLNYYIFLGFKNNTANGVEKGQLINVIPYNTRISPNNPDWNIQQPVGGSFGATPASLEQYNKSFYTLVDMAAVSFIDLKINETTLNELNDGYLRPIYDELLTFVNCQSDNYCWLQRNEFKQLSQDARAFMNTLINYNNICFATQSLQTNNIHVTCLNEVEDTPGNLDLPKVFDFQFELTQNITYFHIYGGYYRFDKEERWFFVDIKLVDGTTQTFSCDIDNNNCILLSQYRTFNFHRKELSFFQLLLTEDEYIEVSESKVENINLNNETTEFVTDVLYECYRYAFTTLNKPYVNFDLYRLCDQQEYAISVNQTKMTISRFNDNCQKITSISKSRPSDFLIDLRFYNNTQLVADDLICKKNFETARWECEKEICYDIIDTVAGVPVAFAFRIQESIKEFVVEIMDFIQAESAIFVESKDVIMERFTVNNVAFERFFTAVPNNTYTVVLDDRYKAEVLDTRNWTIQDEHTLSFLPKEEFIIVGSSTTRLKLRANEVVDKIIFRLNNDDTDYNVPLNAIKFKPGGRRDIPSNRGSLFKLDISFNHNNALLIIRNKPIIIWYRVCVVYRGSPNMHCSNWVFNWRIFLDNVFLFIVALAILWGIYNYTQSGQVFQTPEFLSNVSRDSVISLTERLRISNERIEAADRARVAKSQARLNR